VRRLATALVVVASLTAALLVTGASVKQSKQRYKIEFDNAFGLVEGGDFRVGGVKAGKTSKFDVKSVKGHNPRAVVTAEINQPGFGDFRSDASCTIKPQSLIGEYYVDCQPGSSKRRLPTNGKGVVPVTQTESTVAPDLVNNILRRPYKERFRLIITELGTGLAGRPGDLQAVLRRAHPGLRETSKVLRILGDQNRVIENFIRDSDTVIAELEHNKADVVRWVRETGRAAEISATRREDIARGFRRLPTFLDELRPTMRRLGELSDEQTPLLADLQRAAPSLNTFFKRLGPFSEASRPALRSLGSASRMGTQAFREGAQEIRELKALSRDAAPFAKPLRQFLQTSDDRRRATDQDPRAVTAAPPAPDPTAIPAGGSGGFTGLEAIWNYLFWQSLTINGYDQVAHALRASATISRCSPIKTNITREEAEGEFKECLGWLGPSQPGSAGQPDFTASPATAARLRERASRPARRVGERRAAGQPDAGPLPGQRDISRPQVTLPPALKGLLDQLGSGQKLPSAPSVDQLKGVAPGAAPLDDRSASGLLDYLLAP
jgi:ABC-type transporter Mla subunit MlaD